MTYKPKKLVLISILVLLPLIGLTLIFSFGIGRNRQQAALVALAQSIAPTIPLSVPADGLSHDISGDLIVTASKKGNIHLFNLRTQKSRSIVSGVVLDKENRTRPRIFGTKVVYANNSAGNFDVFLFDTITNTTQQITTHSADQFSPHIDGNRIIWLDTRNGKNDIFLFDLTTNTERRITSDLAKPMDDLVGNRRSMGISGNLIVWIDERSGAPQLFLFDLAKNTERKIPVLNPSKPDGVSISGKKIVWTDALQGNHPISDKGLLLFNLTTNKAQKLPVNVEGFNVVENPDIDGNLIIWTGFKKSGSDIVLYDLTTETVRLVKGGIGDSNMSRISGQRVIFRDFPISPLTVAEICTAAAGDVNGDGLITTTDATLAFNYFLGIVSLSACQVQSADVTQDGAVTPADGLCILQKAKGLASCLD